MFWGLILMFVEVTGEKLVGSSFCHPPPPSLDRVNTITSLRNSKNQPNEDTIYCITSKTKTTKSLNKETRERLKDLLKTKS